jgi:protein BCP1
MTAKREREESEAYSDGVSSDESVSASSSSGDEAGDVSMDFATFNMARGDAPAVRQFLLNALTLKDGAIEVPLTALAEAIAAALSEYVGTAGKQGDEAEDALAVTTIVPCLPVPEVEAVEDGGAAVDALFDLVRKSAAKADKAVRDALRADDVAVVLHERYINLPSQLAAPMLTQLFDDMDAARDECGAFDVKTVVLPTPIYRERPPQDGLYDGRHHDADAESDVWQYYYDEMLVIENVALGYWDAAVKTSHETADSRRAFGELGVEVARRFFVLSLEDLRACVSELESAL